MDDTAKPGPDAHEGEHEDAPHEWCAVHDGGCRGPSWQCTCDLHNDEYRKEGG